MPKEPTNPHGFAGAVRPKLRSIPSATETPRVTRDESVFRTKPEDDAEGTPDFLLGKVMVDVAFHVRRFDALDAKLDALAKQNEKSGVQNQRLAVLVLALVAQQLADASGAGGLTASAAIIAGVILLAVFPQTGSLLVGKVPALGQLLGPQPAQRGASVRPAGPGQQTPDDGPKGPLGAA